jgi:hypothetical protein
MSYFQTFTFREIISLAVVDFEKQARSWSVSSLINIYFNYYIIYCKKKILKVCDMEENREAAEAVNNHYFKRLTK